MSMGGLTKQQLELLHRVKVDPSLSPLVDMLGSMRSSVLEDLARLGDMVYVHQAQGKAQQLKELIDLIEGAKGILEKKVGQPPRM